MKSGVDIWDWEWLGVSGVASEVQRTLLLGVDLAVYLNH